MEIKLINLTRFTANLSTKLVGGFIPLIVYKYATSHKLQLALLTLIIQYFVSFLLNLILRNQLVKRPQVFLFLRIIPIVIYEVLLLFIEANPLACVIGIGLAFSCSYTFKYIPNEVLFAYSNASKKTGTGKQLGITKIVDQGSIILGIIAGGLFLDYLDMRLLIIISISIYLLGALPLLIYYIIHRKDDNFNQEYSSYAHIALKEQSFNTKHANAVSKRIRIIYCIFYFLQESMQAMYVLIPLLTFTITGKFTYSALASALFDGIFGIGCYITGKLDNKKDITIATAIAGAFIGVFGIMLIFVTENTMWIFYVLVSLMALCYSMTYFFMYHRMLMKSKIVGRNITCVINTINMKFLSTCFVVAFGLFFPIITCFCVGGVLSIVSGISSPYIEEKTRRILVDHLEDNEIREDDKIISRRDII